LVILSCVFTGAAILRKDRAAYPSTTFEAARAARETSMASMPHLSTALDGLAAGKTDMVKPIIHLLRQAASECVRCGVGAHLGRGHARMIHALAEDLSRQCSQGDVPSEFDITPLLPGLLPEPKDATGMIDDASADDADDNDDPTIAAAKRGLRAQRLRDSADAARNLTVALSRLPQRRTQAYPEAVTDAISAAQQNHARPLAEWDRLLAGLPVEKRLEIKASLRQRNLIIMPPTHS